MTSLAGETASSTQKVVAPFLRNCLTNQLQNKTRYLVLRSNGPDDFKVALYVCPKHTDADIHSDHSYLDTLGIPTLGSDPHSFKLYQEKFTSLTNLGRGMLSTYVL